MLLQVGCFLAGIAALKLLYPLQLPATGLKELATMDTLKIDTVAIKGNEQSAEEIFENRKVDYKLIYLWGDTKNMITVNPLGGIAINLNKLYNKFSKLGKDSRRLQRSFESEFEANRVNELWLPLTRNKVKLNGDSLFVFETYFRPTYVWLSTATEYEKLLYLKKCMQTYVDSTAVIHERIMIP
ncbi:hypothetical protein ACL9RF_15650 [Sphingobacterium sp. Mn56C]|uniref:hypothetical protein n=1 Tax=Sphingobacterium sp. Mn56C TaxID=3395261 RepID=UPI003BBBA6C0